MANIGGFMGLLFFLYAVIGVQIFYKIDHGEVLDDKEQNFFNFLNAVVLLFSHMTVTDWNMAMHDCMVVPPFCDEDPNNNTCGFRFAPLYFISFLVISSFVLSNLLVAIILDNFNTTTRLERSQVQMADLQRFVEVWAQYDNKATMRIPVSKFNFLLARLRPPLGISRLKSRVDLVRLCKLFHIPEHDGYVHFIETLIPLARCTLGIELSRREIREHEQEWKEIMPNLKKLPVFRVFGHTPATVDFYLSVLHLQAAYRCKSAKNVVENMRQEKNAYIRKYLRQEKSIREKAQIGGGSGEGGNDEDIISKRPSRSSLTTYNLSRKFTAAVKTAGVGADMMRAISPSCERHKSPTLNREQRRQMDALPNDENHNNNIIIDNNIVRTDDTPGVLQTRNEEQEREDYNSIFSADTLPFDNPI